MPTQAFYTSRSSQFHEFKACPVAAEETVSEVIILGTGDKARCRVCAKMAQQAEAA